MTWRPRPRPDWLQEIVDFGDRAPGAAASLVALDADELAETACAAANLDDFGDDAFRARLDTLVTALNDEARLHLAGRLLARSEILRFLENRLLLTRYWHDNPQATDTRIDAPVFVTGMGRSGTSILHELLWTDPRNRAPLTWEMLYPVASRATTEARADRRAALGNATSRFFGVLAPEFDTMHDSSGYLPNECIFITAVEFASDYFGGQYNVPSYQMAMASEDLVTVYAAHKRFLQVLGHGEPERRWVLKAPSHLRMLPALFAVYPDARVVVTHRDPLQVMASVVSLIGTLQWMRSDSVDMEAFGMQLAGGFKLILDLVDQWRADGTVPAGQVIDVSYSDLVGEPEATMSSLYDALGWEFGRNDAARIADHLGARPKDRHGTHAYSFDDTGLDRDEVRAWYTEYQERHDVPNEV